MSRFCYAFRFSHLAGAFIQSGMQLKEDKTKQLWVKGFAQEPNNGSLHWYLRTLIQWLKIKQKQTHYAHSILHVEQYFKLPVDKNRL